MTTDESSADDGPTETSPLRGAVGVLGVVVGVVWAMELGSRGVHPGILFELFPPVALTFVGLLYARKHLLDGSP